LFSCFGASYPGAFTAVAPAAVGKSLDGIFDAVLSVEAWYLALDRFALPAAAICFQSSTG
jgi:hypothetical protein